MQNSKKKIVLLLLASLISLIFIFTNQEKIEDSLHVYSPFEAPKHEFVLLCIAYFTVTCITLYLFITNLSKLFFPINNNSTFWSRVKANRTIIIVVVISILFKQLLYIAQFTQIPFLLKVSMNFDLHIDWYFGSEPNYPHHFFAWEIIFWIFLLSVKLIKRKKLILFPRI